MIAQSGPYVGKYRGTVTANVDPERRGRIQAKVDDVLGTIAQTWAEPCFPYAGAGEGFYAVPPVGALVWIEYEQGNADNPIWTGCRFGSSSDVPSDALDGVPPAPVQSHQHSVVIQTGGDRRLVLSDQPGKGITLRTKSGASIVIDDSGITIKTGDGKSAASIVLSGTKVNINGEAFVVQ